MLALLAAAALAFPLPRTQDPAPAPEPAAAGEAQEAAPTVEDVLQHYEQAGLHFLKGPADGDLGRQAHVAVPEGFYFLDADSARKLLELNENLTSGHELGALWHAGAGLEQRWWVFFEFEAEGYVKDDDREIDAEALMENMKEGNQAGNEERKKRGWAELRLVGWHKPPFYDPKTNNLTWSTLVESDGGQSVNWRTKLLGREGVMSVDLVLTPQKLEGALPAYARLIEGFEYKSGHKYAEFTAGDKIAEYGLAGLVAGGVGALAIKTGLFGKLWKLILIPILAAGAWLKRLFGGSKKQNEDARPPSS